MDKTKRFVFVSIAVLLYFFFIVSPWADDRGFYDLGFTPLRQYQNTYSLMVVPVFISYPILFMLYSDNLRKRILIYPLTVFTLFINFKMFALIGGASAMFLIILLIIPVIILMVYAACRGHTRDMENR